MGIATDLVDYVVDRNVHKQGLCMPGTHQSVRDPSVLLERRPDYTLLLAWNFADEIIAQQADYRRRGGRSSCRFPGPRWCHEPATPPLDEASLELPAGTEWVDVPCPAC